MEWDGQFGAILGCIMPATSSLKQDPMYAVPEKHELYANTVYISIKYRVSFQSHNWLHDAEHWRNKTAALCETVKSSNVLLICGVNIELNSHNRYREQE